MLTNKNNNAIIYIRDKKERTNKMKTVENNLTYGNLVKTDWIKQFNKDQQKQIVLGLEKGLDVSWYANPEYSSLKMCSIISSLEHNIDVSYLDELAKVTASMFFPGVKKNE